MTPKLLKIIPVLVFVLFLLFWFKPVPSLTNNTFRFFAEAPFYETTQLELQVFQTQYPNKTFQLEKTGSTETAIQHLLNDECSLIITRQPLNESEKVIFENRKLVPLCLPIGMLSDSTFLYAISAKGPTSIETQFTAFIRSEKGQLILKKAGISPIYVPSRAVHFE